MCLIAKQFHPNIKVRSKNYSSLLKGINPSLRSQMVRPSKFCQYKWDFKWVTDCWNGAALDCCYQLAAITFDLTWIQPAFDPWPQIDAACLQVAFELRSAHFDRKSDRSLYSAWRYHGPEGNTGADTWNKFPLQVAHHRNANHACKYHEQPLTNPLDYPATQSPIHLEPHVKHCISPS